MRKNDGFILVLALMILAVLMMTSLGASFLSNNNLSVASSVTRQALARYQAEAGIDATLVKLSMDNGANFVFWPCWVNSDGTYNVPTVSGLSYTVRITPLTSSATAPVCPTTAAKGSIEPIVVRSTTVANGAEYNAELVIRPNRSGNMNTWFGYGLVAEGNIDIQSTNNDLHINVYAGGNAFGRAGSILRPGFSAAAVGTTCQIGSTLCRTGATPPQVESPVFETERAALAEKAGPCTVTLPGGSQTIPNPSLPSLAGQVICLSSGTNLTVNDVVSNATILGRVDTTVTFTGSTAPLSPTDPTGIGVRVASGTVNFANAFTSLSGTNTIIAKNPITLDKSVASNDQVSRSLFVSEGDIEIKGQGTTGVYATFWLGGQVKMSGTSEKFFGTIVSKNGISAPGGMGVVRMPNRVESPDIPQLYTFNKPTVLSRR